MTETLYIIGNGFDLYHGIKSSYYEFQKFLRKNKLYDIEDTLNEVCHPSPDWSDLENSLSEFDEETLLRYYNDDIPERIGEASFQAEKISDILNSIPYAMNAFILSLKYPNNIKEKRLEIDESSLFLSFNYTDLLEIFYNISRNNICHIHNKAGENEILILGHGEEIEEEKKKR